MDVKTQKMLADVITDAQKNAVKPYTTTAKVKGVSNGVVYVEIPGSDRLTPVKNSSVAVKKGDIIDLVVSHEDTHITGNRSDVATPQSSTKELSKAMEATRLELDNKLDLTNNKIKMVGNDIEMIDNTITQQGNTITEINNTIDSQNNTITQQGNKIVEINNAVTEVNNKVESQNNTITQIGNTVDQQNNTITEMNNKIDSQNNTIKEMDNTITSQGNTITQLDNKVTSQGNTITQQGNTITEMNSAIETLDSTVKTQGSSIETLDSSVKIIDSAFIIQNGKMTGISEILTNILDSDYVTTDLLNANVAWIENGKIKEGAIGTVEIHDSSITTAKIAELSADVIKTGTLKTECLILTTDEVDPKTGEKKVALITALNAKTKAGEGNILDGAVIKDETIEAAKIKVVDLEAFGATIGNFHIGTSSIYNNKTALNDPTDGVYIGTDGIALGQGSLLNMTDDSLFRVESDGDFHLGGKDNNYINFDAFKGELNINAKTIKMGSSSIATIDDTKNAIASSVEEIVVGGRNMLRNSNFELPGNPNWANLSEYVCITNEGRNGGYCIKQIGDFNTNRTTFNSVGNKSNNIKIKANDAFTFSGWYKVQNYIAGTTNNFVRPYVAYYKSDGSWVTETGIMDVISPDATDWTYVQATFKVPNISTIDYMIFSLYARDYTGIIWWDDIKLEKGNKATDWSPAPEDTLNEVTTTLEKYATLDVTDNKIHSAVTESKAYTDAIQIGGRNLYYLYDFSSHFRNSISKYDISSDGTITLYASGADMFFGEALNKGSVWSPLCGPKMDVSGATSVKYSISNPLFVKNFYTFFDKNEKAMTQSRATFAASATLKVPDGAKYLSMRFGYEASVAGTAYKLKIKVERGNKATDWTPAPEDVETDIQTVKTIAEQTADKFSWLVKSGTSATNFELTDRTATLVANHINLNGLVTFSGLNSDAQNKINTAQSTADGAISNIDALSKSTVNRYNIVNWYVGAKWVKLGTLVSAGDSSQTIINVYSGNGFNSMSDQNSQAEIIIKDGWQSSGDAIDSFGVSVTRQRCEGLLVKVLASSHNTCDIWVYLPWDYSTGMYTVCGQYNSWTHDGGASYQTEEPTTGVAQEVAYRPNAENAQAAADNANQTIADWCYNNDKTYINGGKIYTGSITAEQINVKELFSKSITATNMTISGNSIFGNFYASDTIEGLSYENSNYGGIMYLGKIAGLIDEDEYGFQLGNGNSMTNIQPGGVFVQSNCGGSYSRKTTIHGGFIETYCISASQSGGTVSIGSDIVPLYSDEDTLLDITLGSSSKKFADLYTSKFNGTSVNSDGIASISGYGVTKLSSSYKSSSTSIAANSNAVYSLYNKMKTIVTRGVATSIFISCTYANNLLHCVKINSVTYSMIMFSGVIEVTNGSTAIPYQWVPFFQIPEGFRPYTTIQTVVHVFNKNTSKLSATYAVEIYTDGRVFINGSFAANESWRFVFPCIMYI